MAMATRYFLPTEHRQFMSESQVKLELQNKNVGFPANSVLAIKSLLVPVDFSAASRHGLAFAASLAGQFHARLHLLHVVEPPVLPQWGYARIPRRESRQRIAATEGLPKLPSECGFDPALVASTQVRLGQAEDEICRFAVEGPVDLIVMACHGLGGLQRALVGSTTERVVRRAPCPVLTMRERVLAKGRAGAARLELQRIMVTTDFSDESRKSLPYAAALAREFQASLVLVHVVPAHLPLQLSQLGIVFEESRLMKEARERLPAFRRAELGPDLPVETLVLHGSPAHEICRTAEARGADLIVMATHGHAGLKHYTIGSVTESVVRHAPCPVLVVREHEREFLKT